MNTKNNPQKIFVNWLLATSLLLVLGIHFFVDLPSPSPPLTEAEKEKILHEKELSVKLAISANFTTKDFIYFCESKGWDTKRVAPTPVYGKCYPDTLYRLIYKNLITGVLTLIPLIDCEADSNNILKNRDPRLYRIYNERRRGTPCPN